MNVYTLGIDIGSTASKCVILRNGEELVSKSLIPVGAGTSGPQRAIEQVLHDAGLARADMAYVLATGYGRNSLMDIADQQMSELSCHARGASFLETIKGRCQFSKWFCGHYHVNQVIDERFVVQWEQISRVE